MSEKGPGCAKTAYHNDNEQFRCSTEHRFESFVLLHIPRRSEISRRRPAIEFSHSLGQSEKWPAAQRTSVKSPEPDPRSRNLFVAKVPFADMRLVRGTRTLSRSAGQRPGPESTRTTEVQELDRYGWFPQ